MDTNSAVGLSFFQVFFFFLRELRIIRCGREIVSSETSTAHCRSIYNNESKHFNEDFPVLPFEDYQRHCNLFFALTASQDTADQMHHPELSGENLRLEMLQIHLE